MKNFSRITLFAICMLLLGVTVAQAQTYKDVVARSMFADKKAFNEGDIITVYIVESAEGYNQTDTRTDSDNRLDADASTSGPNITNWIPTFGLSSSTSNRHQATGENTTRGRLESRMTAIVSEVLDNGLLSIEGTRIIEVNGEEQTTVLTGLVRSEDVGSDNTVYSYNIANAQISYKGKGMVTAAGKPGVIARLWNWIF